MGPAPTPDSWQWSGRLRCRCRAPVVSTPIHGNMWGDGVWPFARRRGLGPSPSLSLANMEAAIRARIAYIKSLPDNLFDELTQ